MSFDFQISSGTTLAQSGVDELGRENPAIACLIALTSSAAANGE